MTLVASPLCRGLLGPNADAYNTVRVLLVPIDAIYVVLGGLDK